MTNINGEGEEIIEIDSNVNDLSDIPIEKRTKLLDLISKLNTIESTIAQFESKSIKSINEQVRKQPTQLNLAYITLIIYPKQ